MEKNEKIIAALKFLNPDDNDHWLEDGSPRTGVVQRIAKDMTINRREIAEAWPDFKRVAVEPEPVEAVDFSEDFIPATGVVAPVEASADVPPPEPEGPPDFTREEAEAALRELRGELYGLRNRVMVLTREKIEADKTARQAAVEFELGGRKLTPLELARETIENNQALRAAGVQNYDGTARAFVQKQMRNGNRRPVLVPDGSGGLTLAKLPDGSVARAMPRSRMDLGPMTAPRRPVKV
jgi:hypothetical protein